MQPQFIPPEYQASPPQTAMMPSEIPVSADEVYASYLQEERVKNVISQISPDNQLREIQWRIKGYLFDPLTQQWKKIEKDALEPHPMLVSRFISYLSSLLNQNTTLSNLSSSEINRLMRLVIQWIVDDLDSNSEIYELGEDYTERTRIGHIILNETFTALKRAQNGMESRRIFKALNVTENLSQLPQKKGLLDALKVWK